jgi:hypothetical protein
VAEAAQNLNREFMRIESLLHRLDVPRHEMSYEALCRDPLSEMKRAFRFAEIESDVHLDFRRRTQHIMGNAAMRLGSENSIQERRDWQERLTPQQADEVVAVNSILVKRLAELQGASGYAVR